MRLRRLLIVSILILLSVPISQGVNIEIPLSIVRLGPRGNVPWWLVVAIILFILLIIYWKFGGERE